MSKQPQLPYQLDEEQKRHFARLYLLDYMIQEDIKISVLLDEKSEDLEPILDEMMAREMIEINDQQCYCVSRQGLTIHRDFLKRYRELITENDIFCAVDLEAGEFAFSFYDDYPNLDDWNAFLAADRWDDLRVAVAEYLEQNPVEMIFMSFINEKRFGRDDNGKWQFDLLLGSVWDEILDICNQAIHWPELGYEDDQGQVPAADVIEDIIAQGRAIRDSL
jgi:hypothetical protein